MNVMGQESSKSLKKSDNAFGRFLFLKIIHRLINKVKQSQNNQIFHKTVSSLNQTDLE
ncbi:hypothetical protein SMIC22_08180 [Streptococcus mitis]